MIIDGHQHFWKYDVKRHDWITDEMQVIRKDFLPDDLEKIYKTNHISGCVAIQVEQTEAENDFFVAFTKKYSFIKGVVGWVDLRSPDLESRLAYYSDVKILKGFRHIVQGESPEFLLRGDFCRGISFLNKYNFTYDILVRSHQHAYLEPFIRKFPNQSFIIDHLAKPEIRSGSITSWKTSLQQAASHENVFCKLSGLVTEADIRHWTYEDLEPYMTAALELFGPSRLVYGSDWPVCLVAASYEKQLDNVKRFIRTLSESEQQNILGENAIRFYHL